MPIFPARPARIAAIAWAPEQDARCGSTALTPDIAAQVLAAGGHGALQHMQRHRRRAVVAADISRSAVEAL